MSKDKKEEVKKDKKPFSQTKYGKCFGSVIDKINAYFSIPIILIICLTWFSNLYRNTNYIGLINSILLIVFFSWFISIIRIIVNKNKEELKWDIILFSVCFMIAFILSFSNEWVTTSNTLFIVGMILFEVYLLYLIVVKTYRANSNISNIIILSLSFICLGYLTIYVASFNIENNDLFNSLITLFSAFIGGGITLAGVAWTIKHEKEEKQREEEQKLLQTSPILSFYQFDAIYYDVSKCDSTPHPNWLSINKKLPKKVNSIVVKLNFKNSNNSLIKQININEFSIIVKNKVDKLYKYLKSYKQKYPDDLSLQNRIDGLISQYKLERKKADK